MWSGRKTLTSIDQGLQQVRQQVLTLDAQVQTTSRKLVQLEQDEAEAYRQLARIRLDQLIRGEIISGLDAADQRVQTLLAERDQALQALQARIEASQQEQDALDAERESLRQQVDQASEELDREEAATQQRLQENTAHKELLAAAHTADDIARQAEAKTVQAEADRVEKGGPYEADPLFMYLWERHFGTSSYSAGPLTRFLDGKVAKLCDYHAARPNYAMLLAIPVQLREHAERVRRDADASFVELEAMEAAAADADGIPALRAAVEQADQALRSTDERIRQNEDTFNRLVQERAGYAAAEDEYFNRSIATLVTEFEREGIYSLRQQAEVTVTEEDDRITRKLAGIDAEKKQQQDAMEHHKQMHARQQERLQELQKVRRNFKRERFDDMHSAFDNTGLLAVIMNEFLRGVASSDDLWGTILNNQRYKQRRSNPDFGSGGFGRSRKVWRFPPSRRRGASRAGIGRRGGGFSTRGGF
jgi:chromosome segregation ATPase